MRLRGKIPVFVLGGVAAVVLAAGPAVAHECYNASRSDKGNQQVAANSPRSSRSTNRRWASSGLGSVCVPRERTYLLGQVHAAAALPDSGIDVDWVVSAASLQAGGLEGAKNPRAQENLSNGKGVDHLGANEALGAVIGTNLGAAQDLCTP